MSTFETRRDRRLVRLWDEAGSEAIAHSQGTSRGVARPAPHLREFRVACGPRSHSQGISRDRGEPETRLREFRRSFRSRARAFVCGTHSGPNGPGPFSP
jgi:hypothetical protein